MAVLLVLDLISEANWLQRYIESNERARYIKCDVLGFQLWVDLLDEGLSRDLLINGVREPLATTRYRTELAQLENERGGLTVVDIGANIGYFALQYPAQSREDGTVLAIEPLDSNFSLLEENVRMNGFEDSVYCFHHAIGPESKTSTMQVSSRRNLSTFRQATASHYVDEIDVPMMSLDEFLAEADVSFESVDVLRMDVEGYEYAMFRGMRELLSRSNIGLVFVEIHPQYLKQDGNYDRFLSILQNSGFELVFAADGRTDTLHDRDATYSERELELHSLQELSDLEFPTEIILRRE